MRGLGSGIIGDGGFGKGGVWNHNVVVAQSPQDRGAPADPQHVTFLAGIKFDVIIRTYGPVSHEIEAGKEIAEGLLQSQGDGHAAHAQRCPDRGQSNAHVFEEDDGPQQGEERADHKRGGLGYAQHVGIAAGPQRRKARTMTLAGKYDHHQNHQRQDQLGPDVFKPRREGK